MNSQQAKQIPLSQILERLGHQPHHEVRGELWDFSPFRQESEPSFKVNRERNIWNDYGEGVGGNVLDLIVYCHHRRKCQITDVSFALKTLEELIGGFRPDSDSPTRDQVTRPAATKKPESRPLDVKRIQALTNRALVEYLKERGISEGTARPFVKEIYYTRGAKSYFALAFPNRSGGYELRNAYFKGAHGRKAISLVKRKGEGEA